MEHIDNRCMPLIGGVPRAAACYMIMQRHALLSGFF